MFENQKTITTSAFPSILKAQKFLSALLGCGVIITSLHGAFLNDNTNLTPVDFTDKVVKDLHTHNDHSLQKNIVADPRSRRFVRSDGSKTAKNDRLRDNWDFYRA